MPFSVIGKITGKRYFLHKRLQELKDGHIRPAYFFATELKEGAIESLPDGFEVIEDDSTGLPMLKKAAPPAGK